MKIMLNANIMCSEPFPVEFVAREIYFRYKLDGTYPQILVTEDENAILEFHNFL